MAMAVEQPIVSICIANYNGAEVIAACLDSVLAQDCDFAYEILMHDDASTDGSQNWVAAHYPQVRLIDSRENVGFCIANNRMAEVARGEYLLLLNNDAELFPEALHVLYSAATSIGQPAILSLPQYDATSRQLLDLGKLLDLFLNPIPNLDMGREEVGMVIGACLWISKHLWDELGGFPEWFHTNAEDLYLCSRARLAGYPVRALSTSGYYHHVGHSLGGGKADAGKLVTNRHRRALSERNKSFVMVICYPTLFLLLLLPLHLGLLLLEGIFVATIKREAALWRQIYAPIIPALWQNRSWLFALRKDIQRSRRISLWDWVTTFRIWPYKLEMLIKYGMPEVR